MKRFGGSRTKPRGGSDLDATRLNDRIRVAEVLVIDEKGERLGVLSTKEAIIMAKERGLDLVEVASHVKPPVCKILDYGKLKYTKKKKEQVAKKKSTVITVKEVQFRPRIEEHDFNFKFRHMESFLQRGDKVKVVILFRGREMATAKEKGRAMMERLIELSKEYSIPEEPPKLEGRRMLMVLSPLKAKKSVQKP